MDRHPTDHMTLINASACIYVHNVSGGIVKMKTCTGMYHTSEV